MTTTTATERQLQQRESDARLRELADRWRLPADIQKSIDDTLDELQSITLDCLRVCGPGHAAMRKVEETGTCSHSDRYACEADICLPRIVLDGKGDLGQQLADELYAKALQLMFAADAVQNYVNPIQLTDASPDAAADSPTEEGTDA